jgi:hypothetical protein
VLNFWELLIDNVVDDRGRVAGRAKSGIIEDFVTFVCVLTLMTFELTLMPPKPTLN